MVDRAGLEVAGKLLAKARSTDSDEEAIALAERAYRLLAQAITAYDLERGETSFGPRRRERRRLWDRRANRRGAAPPPPLPGADPAGPYRPPSDPDHQVDLSV